MGRALLAGLLLPLALLFAFPAGSETLRQRADALRDAEYASVSDVRLFSGRLVSEFYAERDYRGAWDADRARALLKLARAGRADGFDPNDFHADTVAHVIDTGQLQAAAETERTAAEVLLSDALLRYVHHFRFGKYNPRPINPGDIFVDKADAQRLKADMERALSAPDLAGELGAMLPDPPFYRNLKKGYQRYLEIADRGDWRDIPGGANLTPGMRDARVALVREHLAGAEGYRPAAVADPDRYDDDLAEAIKGFQRRSGLAQDAVIGPNTLRALNYPLEDRLLTIRANLERMRWLYNDLPDDYVFVDIAAFRLHLFRNGEEVWTTPVVTGTVQDQTPMFRDEMEHIVFNPTWSVPVSIQKKMRGVSSRYQVVDRRTGRRVSGVDTSNHKRYRIVQPAGPSNALGRVKFMFPNGHAIYLHDTPSRHLFSRSVRAFSHGCIRVKDPLRLAQEVLNKPEWDQSTINGVVKRGRTRYVNLDEHLPVLLYYLTAVADDQGRVGFRRDIYNRDERLLAVLDKPADTDRIAFVDPAPESDPELPSAPASAPPSVPDSAPGTEPRLAQAEGVELAPELGPDLGLKPGSELESAAYAAPQPQSPRRRQPTAQSESGPWSRAVPAAGVGMEGAAETDRILGLAVQAGFVDPAATVGDGPMDLRPTLPPFLSVNGEGANQPGIGAPVRVPGTATNGADRSLPTPALLAPEPPEG